MTEKSELSQIIEPLRSQFMIMKECLVCKSKLTDKNIKIVSEENSSYMFHLQCHKCDNALVLLASINEIGVGIVGMMSDLTFEDAKKMHKKDVIDEDFLLDAYQTLYKISFNKYLNLK
ncbi:MAG: hypothetical protein A2493_02750 [Candidatus Magasanikbacteria bacterium RIFOXYC12_FULL_33_11]|uniref:Uncharacterized protein n=1 Tax=Candidatus Magasanikbacteria bacterium RIFOXYC12_FULL_33_11 TaxID=1798701 RepID=A0A1F6NMN3_9BACT|nr:MAG: hypothetical protein A2493_02750 [Candidatus Magasanikbacteria bacterium RIFOXYC12_FULL_33_11]